MDFLDNVVKSSNALIKDRLNNPFRNSRQQSGTQEDKEGSSTASIESSNEKVTANESANPSSASSFQPESGLNDDQTGLIGQDGSSGDKNSQFAAIAADAEAVAQKAVNVGKQGVQQGVQGAKNIGSFLFSMANKAGQTVTQTAKQVKHVVENSTILTDFTQEQQEFIKQHGGSVQGGEVPWSTIPSPEVACLMRGQVLCLSQDKRNFVRDPPRESNFQFDSQRYYPIALTMLKEDPNLGKMRYDLVPKLVNEDTFWRNYFYRVFLLKEMSEKGEDITTGGWSRRSSSGSEGPDEEPYDYTDDPSPTRVDESQRPDIRQQSTENPFDAAVSVLDQSKKVLNEADDLKTRLKELDLGSFDDGVNQNDIEDWDAELQQDLQEFELISGGDINALDEDTIEDEITELKKSKIT